MLRLNITAHRVLQRCSTRPNLFVSHVNNSKTSAAAAAAAAAARTASVRFLSYSTSKDHGLISATYHQQLHFHDDNNSTYLIPRKGTGFDNFLPKDKKENNNEDTDSNNNNNDSNSSSNTDSETKQKKNSKNDWNGWNSGGGGGGGGPESMIPAIVTMLFMVWAVQQITSSSSSSSSSSGDQQQQQQQQLNRGDVSWNNVVQLLQENKIEKIVVAANQQSARIFCKPGSSGLNITDNSGINNGMTMMPPNSPVVGQFVYKHSIGSVDAFDKKLEDVQLELGRKRRDFIPVQYLTNNDVTTAVMNMLPSLLVIGVLFYMSRQVLKGAGGGAGGAGGIFQIGKSTAKKINKEDISITFADVAGCQEAKREIMEFVDFLMQPDQFTRLGAKIPKGALLCGPPGTGKTLLAKAVAGEAGVPFYSASGSDFIEMFVGVGPSRVRDLFKEARANAPCIVFIDEIDAVGRQRGRGGAGGNDERENTLNQLLVEMDGFSPSTGVLVLAATNRVDILDSALTRPGRFDRQIQVDPPDLEGRKAIFKVHLKGIQLEDDVEDIAGRLAGLTPGFAGADIANICNEAAIVAARRKGDSVSFNDFERATDRIVGGLESNKIMSKEERSIVAHHEAGHAIAGWYLEHANPLLKVTIIPRSSGALGYAQYLPKETFLRTHDQIMDIVCMALAGRASEEIFFGGVTTGASDDLKKVTEMVYNMIQIYGMNPRLGQLAFPKDPNAMFDERPYSDATANAMDEEAKLIVDQAYQRTLNLLMDRKEELTKVAAMLLEKETITHDDVIDLIGPRPFKSDPQYDEFVSRRRTEDPKAGETATDDAAAQDEEGMAPVNPGLA